MIASEPKTTHEISEATGIGAGSAARTLKPLSERGAVRRTNGNRWIAVNRK